MKISFSVAAFATAAKALRGVPASSNEIEILGHCLLDADGSALKLTMSDLEIEATATIDGAAEAPCQVALPRAVLDFFVTRAGLGEDAGTLELDDDIRNVVARHGKARMSMPVLPADMFHRMALTAPSWSIRLRAHEFCDALKRCEKAVGIDPSRYMLHGPYLHQIDGALRMVAADGARLHSIAFDDLEIEGALPAHAEAAPGIIIPPKATKEIQRIFSGDESEITIDGSDRLMRVTAERIVIVSKLIDAQFFDYIRMLPPKGEGSIRLSGEALSRAIDGLLVVPKSDTKGKRETSRAIQITINEKEIQLDARGDIGETQDTLDVETEGVTPGTLVRLNAQFLRDALDAAAVKQITVHPPGAVGGSIFLVGDESSYFVVGQRAR